MVKIIGLGEHLVSKDIKDSIKTYALASCVGLVVYNEKDHVLGMVHIVLPDKTDTDGPQKEDGYFAETAVPLIFDKVFGRFPGEEASYKVSLFGGCVSKNKNDVFNVGERNVSKIEEILISKRIRYDKRNTGGHCSRTIEAYVKDGRIVMKTQKMII